MQDVQPLQPTHSRSRNEEHTLCEVSIDRFSVERSSKRTNAMSKWNA